MPKKSAGVLLYRFKDALPEVLLFHPGGPFWKKKNLGVWSIAKGEINENEKPIEAAIRELEEESGIQVRGRLIELQPVRLRSYKIVYAWALEQDFNPDDLISSVFEIEWPPSSGKFVQFPEMDRACWFPVPESKEKITAGQLPFIEELEIYLLT